MILAKIMQFYGSLQGVLDHTPRRDIRIFLGDFNAKIGHGNTGKERVMGQHGLGCMNDDGERFKDFNAFNDFHSLVGAFFSPRNHSEGHVDLPGWTNFHPDELEGCESERRSRRCLRSPSSAGDL